jgi:hypothetical protein
MTLRLTQPLTEISTINLPGGKVQPVRKVNNLTANCEKTVYKIVVGFSIGGVEPSSSATGELVRYKKDPEENQMLTTELDKKRKQRGKNLEQLTLRQK